MSRYRVVAHALIGCTLLLAFFSVFWPRIAGADAHATFKQQILPLNCVFEIVNDGTNTLRYLTPAECGVLIPSPVSNNVATTSNQTATLPTSNSKVVLNNSNSLAPPSSSSTINSPPWQPIVSKLKSYQAKGLSPVAGTTTFVALAVFICLVIVAIVAL